MDTRRSATIAIFFLAVACTGEAADESDTVLIHPDQIERCLKSPEAAAVEVNTATNPYYLRGDFDGDGRTDYAVAVNGRTTRRNGVFVCSGQGKVFILGADQPLKPPFSDMPDDNFFAPNWSVYSKAETRALGRFKSGDVPVLPRRILGETIAMIWEDGIALIYWDGRAFKWTAN
jgi:hypothetical protein